MTQAATGHTQGHAKTVGGTSPANTPGKPATATATATGKPATPAGPKKVGGPVGQATQPGEKKGPGGPTRADFVLKDAVDADKKTIWVETGEGDEKVTQLTAVPANWDVKKHKQLVKEDFTDEATYLDFKAGIADSFAKTYSDTAGKYRAAATKLRKYGDPEQRKRISKLERMKAVFAKYAQSLKDEGMELDPDMLSLGADLEAGADDATAGSAVDAKTA